MRSSADATKVPTLVACCYTLNYQLFDQEVDHVQQSAESTTHPSLHCFVHGGVISGYSNGIKVVPLVDNITNSEILRGCLPLIDNLQLA